jgi:hypothetical protein
MMDNLEYVSWAWLTPAMQCFILAHPNAIGEVMNEFDVLIHNIWAIS